MKKTLIGILVRLSYHPSLFFNRAMCAARIWRRWDKIDDHVYVGGLPDRTDIAVLRALGIGGVINMCGEFPGHAVELETHGVAQLHLPTLDYHSPTEQDMIRGIEFIHEHVAAGQGVYIHCKAGRGRSVTLAVCYLMAAHGLTPEEAHRRIRNVRPQIDRRVVRRKAVHAIRQALSEGKLSWAPRNPAVEQETGVAS